MEDHVLRNFNEHLLPLAGKGPHVCLHLGIQNPSHAHWLCANALPCCDDRYFGTCDFGGSAAMYKTTVDLLGQFANADLWHFDPVDFLSQLPPAVVSALILDGPTLVYIDGDRDHATFEKVLQESWNLLRPGGTCIINGYRTGRRKHELYPVIDLWAETVRDIRIIFQNRQFGFQKAKP